MQIWNRILGMSFRQMFRLAILFLKNPLLVIPTLSASKKTIEICNKHFGNAHHNNGIENAFRHALWNALLCQYSLKITKNRQKSVFWAQKVTNLYEKVTKNDRRDKAMDLHNNNIGRMLFLEQKTDEFEHYLLKMMRNGQKMTENDSFSFVKNKLTYIS